MKVKSTEKDLDSLKKYMAERFSSLEELLRLVLLANISNEIDLVNVSKQVERSKNCMKTGSNNDTKPAEKSGSQEKCRNGSGEEISFMKNKEQLLFTDKSVSALLNKWEVTYGGELNIYDNSLILLNVLSSVSGSAMKSVYEKVLKSGNGYRPILVLEHLSDNRRKYLVKYKVSYIEKNKNVNIF
jgi:hypothetical protein